MKRMWLFAALTFLILNGCPVDMQSGMRLSVSLPPGIESPDELLENSSYENDPVMIARLWLKQFGEPVQLTFTSLYLDAPFRPVAGGGYRAYLELYNIGTGGGYTARLQTGFAIISREGKFAHFTPYYEGFSNEFIITFNRVTTIAIDLQEIEPQGGLPEPGEVEIELHTSSSQPVISWQPDPDSDGYRCSLDGSSWTEVGNQLYYVPPYPMDEGEYLLFIQSLSRLTGNWEDHDIIGFSIDSTAPAPPVISLAADHAGTGFPEDAFLDWPALVTSALKDPDMTIRTSDSGIRISGPYNVETPTERLKEVYTSGEHKLVDHEAEGSLKKDRTLVLWELVYPRL